MLILYETIGVYQDASHLEIEKAYHRTMLEHHPDKDTNIPDIEKAKHEAITKEANYA